MDSEHKVKLSTDQSEAWCIGLTIMGLAIMLGLTQIAEAINAVAAAIVKLAG